MENIVTLKNACVTFDANHHVLKDLNLQIQANKRLTILGPGGCGKSTLLKTILGIVPLEKGEIKVFETNLNSLSELQKQQLRKKIGIAFQQGALFDFMTVKENIFFAMENMTTFSKEEQEQRLKTFLALVNLVNIENRLPSELSGGMRRRVGIVRAMITNPQLALLDEPTAGLDPVTTSLVIDMIHSIGEKTGTTLVCVTSSVEVAFRFAHKVALMKNGKIIAHGNFKELIALGDPWIVEFLTSRSLDPRNSLEHTT